jgi:phage baseplate assembly protein V
MSEDYFHHRNVAHRYEITKVDDSGDIQMIDGSGMEDELHTEIMRVFPHGFTSNPPIGAHMLAMGLGGRRDSLVAVGGEHPDYRPKNTPVGDSALYNADGTIWKMIGKSATLDAKENITQTAAKSYTVKVGNATATITPDNIKLDVGGTSVNIKAGRVDLGGLGGAAVVTLAGPSSIVFAKV